MEPSHELRETVVIACAACAETAALFVDHSRIIIGVAAVIILVALGNGVKAGFDAQFSKLATRSPSSGHRRGTGGGEARTSRPGRRVAAGQQQARTSSR